MRYIFICLCSIFSILSFTAHSAYSQNAQTTYKNYTQAIQTAQEIEPLSMYLSSELLQMRNDYVSKTAKRKNLSHADINKRLLERAQYSESCISGRTFIAQEILNPQHIILRYKFKDICAAPNSITADIEEVSMRQEKGAWKVDHVTARPSTPQKVKKVIHLE